MFQFNSESRREMSRIGLLLLGLVSVCALFSMAVLQAIQRIKVNGPIYADIIEQKDIIADILPPPLYVIESYLSAIHLSDPAFDADRELLEQKIATLQKEFESRQTHWFDSLAPGSIRGLVLNGIAEPAREFFRIINEQIIPAVRQGKHSEAQEITRIRLRSEYLTHRIAIDDLVQQSTKKTIRVEAMAARELDSSYLPRILAAGLLVLAIFLCMIVWMFSRTNRKAIAIANRMTAELKANERELRASLIESARLTAMAKLEQERLKSIFAAQSEGIVLQNKAGEIIECNGAAQQILGLTADQLKGRTSLDPRWKATLENGTELCGDQHPATVTLRTGRSIRDFVMGIESPDRGTRWINVNTEPILDESGTVTSVVTSFADITQLREQSKRLGHVIEASKIGIWDWDIATGNVEYSENWARMLGYESSEIEPNVSAWEMILNPHDLSKVWTNARKHLDGELAEYRNEMQLRRKDGTFAWVLSTGKVIEKNPDGSPKRMVGIHIDLSQTKKLELQFKELTERYSAAISGTSDGMWDWTIGTDNVWYSDRFWILLGFPERGPFPPNKLNSFVERVHPEDLPNVMEAGAAYNVEYRLRHEAGHYRWIRARGATQFDEDRKPIRMAGSIQDIHDRKSAEFALVLANQQAMAANSAKSEFLANMSHEIRTPLTAILGYADLIEHEVDTLGSRETKLEYIEIVRRNGQHLLQVVNDILDISKIEAGKMTVENIVVNPAKLIEEVVALMAVGANATGIEFNAVLPPDLPSTIRTDPNRLRQVLVNLVGNAIKFTKKGSVSLQVDCNRKDQRMSFAIVDTGIGLSQEQIDKSFGAFEQADLTVTRKYGGTGLGLRISKHLTQLLGGDITIQSIFGIGSTFTATIATGLLDSVPTLSQILKNTALGEQPQCQECDGSDLANSSALQLPLADLRILLAEDGTDNQRLISYILRKAGAEVQIAENGKVAIEMLTIDGTLESPLQTPCSFDLLLSDMQMPVMDGYEAASWLRNKGSTIPIVALTAHAMNSELDLCISVGCNAYATKPIDKVKLIEVCRQWGSKLPASIVPRLSPVLLGSAPKHLWE